MGCVHCVHVVRVGVDVFCEDGPLDDVFWVDVFWVDVFWDDVF